MKKTSVVLWICFCVCGLYAQNAGVYTDSTFSAYKVHAYTDSSKTVKTYKYSAIKRAFLPDEETFSLYGDGRMLKYLVFDEKGDSSGRVEYSYLDSVNDVEYRRYKYSLKKAKLRNEGHFYGTKMVENEILRLLGEYLEYDMYICDSMKITTYNTLLDVHLDGRFFGNVAEAKPDSLQIRTSIAGIDVCIRGYMKVKDSQLTDMRVFISALDGKVDAQLLKAHADYNADGKITLLEIWPFKTQVFNLYKEMDGFSRREYRYEGNQIRCFSEYKSSSTDTADIVYKLDRRTYYTYRDGVLDSMLIYNKYKNGNTPDDTLSIAAQTLQNVEIYPNPVKDMLTVSGLEESARMEICSTDGRRLLSAELESGENRISLQPLAPGIYFVKLQDSRCSCVKKIMKK